MPVRRRWSDAPLAERVADLRSIVRRRAAQDALRSRGLEQLARRTFDPGLEDPGWDAAFAEARDALADEGLPAGS